MNLKGKTAIVTGSSRGIDSAIAFRLAKDGANVKKAQANVEIFEKQLDIEAVPDLYSVEAKYKYN